MKCGTEAAIPTGLKGEEIPMGARITAVAEAYSAMTSWRPYRGPWDVKLALNEIRKATDKGCYDPRIVDILFEVLKFNSPTPEQPYPSNIDSRRLR